MAALGTCLQVLTASNRSSDNNVIIIAIHFNSKKYVYFCKLRSKVRLQTFGRCEIPTHDKFPKHFLQRTNNCRQLPRNNLATSYELVGDVAK